MQPLQLIIRPASRISSREDGQGLAEYALILALIAVVAIIALIFMGTQISDAFNMVGESVDAAI
jgi:pilus assembly protein Flp/PilA